MVVYLLVVLFPKALYHYILLRKEREKKLLHPNLGNYELLMMVARSCTTLHYLFDKTKKMLYHSLFY